MNRNCLCLPSILFFLYFCPTPAFPQTSNNATPSGGMSESEINKQLINPVSTIWDLTFQEDTYWIHPGVGGASERNQVDLDFQPVMPVSLNEDWNLVNRVVFPAFDSSPYVTQSGFHRVTGFGDTILASVLSPSPQLTGRWILGLGPTFVFPTASNGRLGQGMWQIGPAGVLGYLGEKWVLGLFPSSDSRTAGGGRKA